MGLILENSPVRPILQKIKILLIEDDPSDAEYIRELLAAEKQHSFKIEHAERLSDGLARLARGGIDLVLLDLGLPDSHGIETMAGIQMYAKSTPVVVLTGLDDEQIGVQAIRMGAQDYVCKEDVGRHLLSRAMLHAIQRSQMIEALRRSEERFRDLFDNANDPILVLSAEERFLYVNRAWCRALGYTEEETGRLTMLDLVHPDQRMKWIEIQRRIMNRETQDRFETTLVTKSGRSIVMEGVISCFFQNNKPTLIRCIFRDITEQKRLDQLKDDFVTTVSHEIRTPLTVIKGALDNLKGGVAGPLESKQFDFVEMAYRNAAYLSKIITTILDLSRLQSGKTRLNRRPVNLQRLIRESVDRLKKEFRERGLGVEIVLPSARLDVFADAEMIEQVLTNLLNNAIRFARKNIRISGKIVEGAFEPDPRTVGRAGAGTEPPSPRDGVRISVDDDGPGIPGEKLHQIFQKFVQLDRSSDAGGYKGTGLGLTICREIVNLHAGRIWVESEFGKGSVFHFMLPRFGELEEIRTRIMDAVRSAEAEKKMLTLLSVNIANFDEIRAACDETEIEKMYHDIQQKLLPSLRSADDMIRRFDGRIVILAGTDQEGARVVRERIEKILDECGCKDRSGRSIAVGVRMGVATFGVDSNDPDELVEIAFRKEEPKNKNKQS